MLEFINTERDYVRDLQILVRVYMEGMREQKVLSSSDLYSLFGGIDLLIPIHMQLLRALEAKQAENPVIRGLGTGHVITFNTWQ